MPFSINTSNRVPDVVDEGQENINTPVMAGSEVAPEVTPEVTPGSTSVDNVSRETNLEAPATAPEQATQADDLPDLSDTSPTASNILRASYYNSLHGDKGILTAEEESFVPESIKKGARALNIEQLVHGETSKEDKAKLLGWSKQVLGAAEEQEGITPAIKNFILENAGGMAGSVMGDTVEFATEALISGGIAGYAAKAAASIGFISKAAPFVGSAIAGGLFTGAETASKNVSREARGEETQSVGEAAATGAAFGVAIHGTVAGVSKGIKSLSSTFKGKPTEVPKDSQGMRIVSDDDMIAETWNGYNPQGDEYHVKTANDSIKVVDDVVAELPIEPGMLDTARSMGNKMWDRLTGKKIKEVVSPETLPREAPENVPEAAIIARDLRERTKLARYESHLESAIEEAGPEFETYKARGKEMLEDIDAASRQIKEAEGALESLPEDATPAERASREAEVAASKEKYQETRAARDTFLDENRAQVIQGRAITRLEERAKAQRAKLGEKAYELPPEPWRTVIAPDATNFLMTDLGPLFQIETKGGVATFNETMPYRTVDDLGHAVSQIHFDLMAQKEALYPGHGAMDHLLEAITTVGPTKQAYEAYYKGNLADGLDLADIKKLRKEIHGIGTEADPQADIYRAIATGDELGPQHSRALNQLTSNMKEALERSRQALAKQGVAINKIEGYVPHHHNMKKILDYGEKGWSDFTRDRLDWDRMFDHLEDRPDLAIKEMKSSIKPTRKITRDEKFILNQVATDPSLKQAAWHIIQDVHGLSDKPWRLKPVQQKILRGIYEGMQETEGTISSGGFGMKTSTMKNRFLHFKSPEAYTEYAKSFGRTSVITESVFQHLNSASRAQAVYEIFGPKPVEVIKKLSARANKYAREAGTVDDIRFKTKRGMVSNYSSVLFERSPASNYSDWGPSVVLNKLDSANRLFIVKNSFLYSLTEEPITRAVRTARLTGDPLKGVSTFFKSYKDLLHDPHIKKMAIEGRIDMNIIPDVAAMDASLPVKGAAKLKELFRTLSFDFLSERNKAGAARDFEGVIHDTISKKAWSEAPKNLRSMLRSVGLTEKDYKFMQKNLSKFEKIDHPYPEFPQEYADITYKSLTTQHFVDSESNYLRSLGFRLRAAQQKFVNQSVVIGRPDSLAPFIGRVPQIPFIGKNITAFTSWMGHQALNAMDDTRINKYYTGSNEAKGTVMPWAKALGAIYVTSFFSMMYRNELNKLVRGRYTDWDDRKQVTNAIKNAAFGAASLPYLESVFNQYSYSGNFKESMESVAGKAVLGPTLSKVMDVSTNFRMAMDETIKGDTHKSLRYWKKLMPFAEWAPANLIVNRLLLDSIIHYAVPDANSYFQSQRTYERQYYSKKDRKTVKRDYETFDFAKSGALFPE